MRKENVKAIFCLLMVLIMCPVLLMAQSAESLYTEGRNLHSKGKVREALPIFEKAAQLGHTDAMVRYADCLKIVAEVNFQNAVMLGATSGNIYLVTSAQECLTNDLTLANMYYQKAADAGNVTAMQRLGREYQDYLRNSGANSNEGGSVSRTQGTTKEEYQENCYQCKGFGYTPDFRPYGGRGERRYCSTCGRNETTHDHYVCGACNGQGKINKSRLK